MIIRLKNSWNLKTFLKTPEVLDDFRLFISYLYVLTFKLLGDCGKFSVVNLPISLCIVICDCINYYSLEVPGHLKKHWNLSYISTEIIFIFSMLFSLEKHVLRQPFNQMKTIEGHSLNFECVVKSQGFLDLIDLWSAMWRSTQHIICCMKCGHMISKNWFKFENRLQKD